MNLIDSSAWLAFFADTRNADIFMKPISDCDALLIPTIVMYEVSKVLLKQRGEEAAIVAQAHMQQGNVVVLDTETSLRAAAVSLEHKLPMVHSIILATSRIHNATVWTQDADFKGIEGVRFHPA